ncbi:MAG TPA: membrane protein insertion efficiency factor YidD [Alphaproteobacteria bacterium]|nr:membrane protein insertion efficiency factor YidD [Alphaproteobacteria bacterium]
MVDAAIRLYQLSFAAVLGGHCRYHPHCSAYARQAVQKHGMILGMLLGLLRILRCGPWGGHGFDPVPAVWHDALPLWLKRLKIKEL